MSNQEVMNYQAIYFSKSMAIQNRLIWDIIVLSSWKLTLLGWLGLCLGNHPELDQQLCAEKLRVSLLNQLNQPQDRDFMALKHGVDMLDNFTAVSSLTKCILMGTLLSFSEASTTVLSHSFGNRFLRIPRYASQSSLLG